MSNTNIEILVCQYNEARGVASKALGNAFGGGGGGEPMVEILPGCLYQAECCK